jgi:hypothetical protein
VDEFLLLSDLSDIEVCIGINEDWSRFFSSPEALPVSLTHSGVGVPIN